MNLTNPVTLTLWSAMAPAAAWGVWQYHRARPARPVAEGVWITQPNGDRKASGASMAKGRVVYVHVDYDGRVAYVGKATQFARRMAQHGQMTKSHQWSHWYAYPVPRWQPSFRLEHRMIRDLKPYQNRNRGTTRLRLRTRLLWWRY